MSPRSAVGGEAADRPAVDARVPRVGVVEDREFEAGIDKEVLRSGGRRGTEDGEARDEQQNAVHKASSAGERYLYKNVTIQSTLCFNTA